MSHKQYRKESNCLNCGTEVAGKFCQNCGQENIEVKENFFHLAFHFVSDYFHFDSKFFRSMLPLFAKPGFLTKQYWDGKRVNYIHPLRLYFFSIIVAVLCTSFFYEHYEGKVKSSVISVDSTPSKEELDSLKNVPNAAEIIREKSIAERKVAYGKISHGIDRFMHDLKYISFFLLPLYAIVFKLLYIRRKSFYVDHLVYTMHLQSFAMLLTGFFLLIPFIYAPAFDIVNGLSYFIIFVYIVISLRYLYQQSWVKTIFKSVIATVLVLFLMSLVFGVYMIINLLGNGSQTHIKF